jgi:hypothetical protein
MKNSKLKLFVLRKYVRAHSAAEAIRKEKSIPVDDVWIDDEWKKGHLADAMGFNVPRRDV